MNWIKNFVRPKFQGLLGAKRDVPENMWVTCPESGEMVFYRDLEANLFVVPGSNFHMKMESEARMAHMFDDGVWAEIDMPQVTIDPLKFRDQRRYTDRLKQARAKTGQQDAVRAGLGRVDDLQMVIAVQDFAFMGGSLGMAAGEAIIKSMRTAVENSCPYVLFVSSGGARMQEGILSLMQMPRTTVAVEELRRHHLPYIVVLTHPTTGGVTASYAMLGDVHLAEPKALIGFAGPRVIEQTIREQLPEGFQKSEYLREHGMVDAVVHRHEMRATIRRITGMLMRQDAGEQAEPEKSVEEEADEPVLDQAAE